MGEGANLYWEERGVKREGGRWTNLYGGRGGDEGGKKRVGEGQTRTGLRGGEGEEVKSGWERGQTRTRGGGGG